jgi:hypothetical protein
MNRFHILGRICSICLPKLGLFGLTWLSQVLNFPANDINSFFFMLITHHHVYMPIFFIHSSVDRLLSWFHILAVVNSTVINMGMQVSWLEIELYSFIYMYRTAIAGSYSSFVFDYIGSTYWHP